MIDFCSYVMSRKERMMFSLVILAGCTAIGYIFYKTIITAVFAPVIYKRCEKIYSNYMIGRKKKVLIVEFKDFLNLTSSALATGKHMISAMQESKEGLNRIYPNSILAGELEYMIGLVEDAGKDDAEVWNDFSKRTQLEDIEDFAQVYQCCRQTGGNLIEAVNKAATIIGEKITMENEIRTVASQKKLEGRIIASMPVVIILFLQILSPDYLNVMYETIAGRSIMTVAFAVTIAACVAIERITDIEI